MSTVVRGSGDTSEGSLGRIVGGACKLWAADVHLFYRNGMIGQRDLPLAPDARSGFEMVLLRMLAFQPEGESGRSESAGDTNSSPKLPESVSSPEEISRPTAHVLEKSHSGESHSGESHSGESHSGENHSGENHSGENHSGEKEYGERKSGAVADRLTATADGAAQQVTLTDNTAEKLVTVRDWDNGGWLTLWPRLNLQGVTRNLAANCGLVRIESNCFQFVLSEQHVSLWNKAHEKKIARELSEYFDRQLLVSIDIGTVNMQTPAQYQHRRREQQQVEAVKAIKNDKNIQILLDDFNGTIKSNSISPLL